MNVNQYIPGISIFLSLFSPGLRGTVKPQTESSLQVQAGKVSAPALVRSRLEEGGSSGVIRDLVRGGAARTWALIPPN